MNDELRTYYKTVHLSDEGDGVLRYGFYEFRSLEDAVKSSNTNVIGYVRVEERLVRERAFYKA